MSDANWSTLLAHFILAATCGWADHFMTYQGIGWIRITLMLHHAVGLLGVVLGLVIICGGTGPDDEASNLVRGLANIYTFFFVWGLLLGLPCAVAQFYSTHGYSVEVCLVHVSLALVPLVTNDRTSLDCCVLLNLVSLAVVSVAVNNPLGLAAMATYAVNYFGIRPRTRVGERSAKNLYVGLLALFTYLAVMALKLAK